MMAPARTPDVGAFMDNLGALRAMLGPSVASRMQTHGEDQEARWDAGERGPTPLTEDRVWLADDVAGALLGPMGMAGVIKAYHGSPHRFDRFDMSKIGTGEGAQAFGHGLYMAGNPGVAKSYKTTGPAGRALLDEVNAKLKSVSREMSALEIGGQYRKFRDPKRGEELVEEYERLLSERSNLGNLYTVKLDVEPDDLLDWDVPLSEQSEKVRAAIEEIRDVYRDLDGVGNALDGDIRGGQLVQLMQGILGGKDKATQEMRAAGIHGIKFLDQGSRLPVARARKPVDEWLRTIDGATAKLKKLDDEAAALPGGNPAADSMRQRLADERARVQRNMDNAREQLSIAEKYNRDMIDEAEALATRNFVIFDDSLVDITHVDGKPLTKAERKAAIAAMLAGGMGAMGSAEAANANK